MASVGMDDSLKMFDQTTSTYLGGNNATKLKAQPRGLDHKGGLTVITTVNSITMVRSYLINDRQEVQEWIISVTKKHIHYPDMHM